MQGILDRMASGTSRRLPMATGPFINKLYKNYVYLNPIQEIQEYKSITDSLYEILPIFQGNSDLSTRFCEQFESFIDIDDDYQIHYSCMIVKKNDQMPVYQLDRLDGYLLDTPTISKVTEENITKYIMISQEIRSKLEYDAEHSLYYLTSDGINSCKGLVTQDMKLGLMNTLGSGPAMRIMEDFGKYYIRVDSDPNIESIERECRRSVINSLISSLKYIPPKAVLDIYKKYTNAF